MTRMPPVPPAQRSPKGTGSSPKTAQSDARAGHAHFEEQHRQDSIKQNTHNQSRQQDR
ncbi:hypothetical protein [Afipia felis]|uniref:Uncharacterized protein n=2 Tax=Afipia felis TaxID=1035 RepID=A0A380W961_AFIFE|nr:hypothetical protein [Afipia felis]EKS28707.1 hypothetical protein HMPREF9697_01235 [Afipia felis ATCC 53690]SUU77414.1 Uncharacterised protein [Afipia felis]SUU85481.1 Uncharacterised protein [Afipia felis]